MSNSGCLPCFLSLVGAGILLTIILVPLSFSYVEYYEYGLDQRKTTGSVDVSKVYGKGRHSLGVDHRFIKYQADAHLETLRSFSVFSAGGSNSSIGLDFAIDLDFTFLLNKDDIGKVHQEIATSYRDVILSRAKDAIKNEAIYVTFSQFFRDRKAVEARFREAVQNRWNAAPPLHCFLDQFHLGRIEIPRSVGLKQLEAKIQNERNDREAFLQQAQVEREMTAVQVNTIYLEEQKILRTARAEASLVRSKGKSEAEKLVANAQTEGTLELIRAADISGQEQLTAFTYIRTLQQRGDVELNVNYLTPENIVKTQAV